MHVSHATGLADFELQGIGGHEAQGSGAKGFHGGVAYFGHHRHLQLRQARDAQGLDEFVIRRAETPSRR